MLGLRSALNADPIPAGSGDRDEFDVFDGEDRDRKRFIVAASSMSKISNGLASVFK